MVLFICWSWFWMIVSKYVMHLNTYTKHTLLFNKWKSLLKVYVFLLFSISPILYSPTVIWVSDLTGLSLNSPELTLSLRLHKWWFINFLKHARISTPCCLCLHCQLCFCALTCHLCPPLHGWLLLGTSVSSYIL